MILLETLADMQAALKTPLSATLHALLVRRVNDTIACDLTDLTQIVIIEPGDTEDTLLQELGFSPTIDRTDGLRFGDDDFLPDWDWHVAHTGWWELIYTFGNDGFACILFVPDDASIDRGLLNLCRTFAQKGGEGGAEP